MVKICEGGGPLILGGSDGVLFPLVHIESQVLGGILYFIGLMWCFQGVGIISDIFMNAIEKITSAKKRVPVTDGERAWDSISPTASQGTTKSEPRLKTVKVWNDTVANLTLMALGSSAPEILLSVIELAPNKMKSGALGPSTIVGSAAFNLLIITAVCVSAIPEGEERRIKDISVFAVTATFSIFAYLWLIVILVYWSPDEVTPIEGLLTIALLPILVWLAYLADIGAIHKMLGRVKTKSLVFSHDTSVEDYHTMMELLKQKYPKMPDTKEAEHLLLRYEFPEKTTRAVRRMEATRGYSGQFRKLRDRHLHILGEYVSQGLKPGATNGKVQSDSVLPAGECGEADHKPNAIFEFVSGMYAVSEADKKVLVTVRRGGNEQTSASCKFRTVPGTAKRDEDYVHKQGQLDFSPGETEKTIEIDIVEDKKFESTEEFYVELGPVPGAGIVGLKKSATVVVLDSDSPGELRFENDTVTIAESSQRVKKKIRVERVGGCNGTLKCAYRTEDDSAKAGKDYEEISGELVFSKGVAHTFVEVAILPVASVDQRKEMFRLIIEPCNDGPVTLFDATTDGGSDSGICTITIESDESGRKQYNACLTAAASHGVMNMDGVDIGRTRWKAQFLEAVYVGGDPESQAEAGVMDWTFHIISVPWKVLFAVVPPTDFCGGKLCFVCALFMIGICTALIGDLANLLGCAMNIPPEICAITFVALGTSLPDTFASKTAAVQDPTADNSIGNVTGSNSVNVFLGLGLSWSTAAIYWEFNGDDDDKFVVNAGTLGPSVGVFCGCAGACISLLLVRRWTLGAELGGPVLLARMSSAFLVLLWLVYIVSAVLMVED
jgi:solute carrier family 8 (sodium/calcium exchanger)